MIKIKYKIFVAIIVLVFLNSCQGAVDALQGKKRSKGGDEFLVEKKNPLSMPPDYKKLPVPGGEENTTVKNETSESDIKKLLNIKEKKSVNKKSGDKSTDVESSILKKIK